MRVIEALWLVNGGHGAPLNISRHAGPGMHASMRARCGEAAVAACLRPASARHHKPAAIGSPWSRLSSQCQRFGHPPRPNDQPFFMYVPRPEDPIERLPSSSAREEEEVLPAIIIEAPCSPFGRHSPRRRHPPRLNHPPLLTVGGTAGGERGWRRRTAGGASHQGSD
eukprot:COSAG01_NODE_312_length_19063_cov_207.879825_18_plen_167_part_00